MRRFATEAAFEFGQLIGIENVFNAIRSAIHQSWIKVGLGEQINLPKAMPSDGVASFLSSA